MFDLNAQSASFEEAIDFFRKDITSLRTGRATPSLVEHIMVEAYGAKSPLIQLASISISDARTLVIQPWDKSIVKDIEKSLMTADVNTTPVVDSTVIRLSLPALTEENRKDLVKILNHKAENARVSLRQQREKIRSVIAAQEKSGALSEDEKFQAQKELEEMVKQYTNKIKEIADHKESEIMSI